MTLLQLNRLVRETIEQELSDEYWVEAELSECRENRGHCYMELVQRDDRLATPVARAQARCWASRWAMLQPYFERATGQQLRAGLKVLLRVTPQFHEAYGFSWIVNDIDPTYTLGDQARRRQEIVRQLKQEGVFDLQRELQLPLFCLNIAVISSPTAAGYGDFAAQLADSPFAFSTRLFAATMQGEGIEQSIIEALDNINRVCISSYTPHGLHSPRQSSFDCVVIIRGGGATSDLAGFDTLALAENVANFPLPIITGIGHDRDECILDMVSHLRLKTPTAVAAYLIDHAQTVLNSLENCSLRIGTQIQRKLQEQRSRLTNLGQLLPVLTERRLTKEHHQLDSLGQRLLVLAERRLTKERHQLEMTEQRLKSLDPELLLKRGYSITLKNGQVVKSANSLQTGDEIETRLSEGIIKSIIK